MPVKGLFYGEKRRTREFSGGSASLFDPSPDCAKQPLSSVQDHFQNLVATVGLANFALKSNYTYLDELF